MPTEGQIMSRLKVAVLGLRWVGQQHLKGWSSVEGADLRAAADLDADLLRDTAETYGVEATYEDYRKLLAHSDAELISVCLPTGMHHDVVIECLESGRHVLCEKPPAESAEQAARMRDAAVAHGRVLGYSLQRRCTRSVQGARHAVAEGRIGDVWYARAGWIRVRPGTKHYTPWRLDAERGGGSLGDLGVHMLDSAWFAMGCPAPVSVSGMLSTRQIPGYCERLGIETPDHPADDSAAALIRFENGATMFLESSFGMWRTRGSETWCELMGSSGGIQIDPEARIKTGEEPEALAAPQDATTGGHSGVCEDFARALRNQQAPCATADHGVQLLRMLDAVAVSSRQQREVTINPD